jgi:uncharacterized protein YndB with AHSA1/START domain
MENKNSDTKDRELFISRLLNAPVELVWEAITQPEHIANWWGPDGFTNTMYHLDLVPGGEWHFMMHGPDGTDYENKSTFVEVVPLKKLVFDNITYPYQRFIITLETQGEKTHLTWHMVFPNREDFINVVKNYGAAEGLDQNIARMEAYIAGIKK